MPLLSWIVFLPLFGALVCLFINRNQQNALKWTAFLFTIADFILTLILFVRFDGNSIGMQFRDGPMPWIRSLGVTFSLGVDGISILLVVLTPFLSIIAIASAWNAIKDKVKGSSDSRSCSKPVMLGVFLCLPICFLFYLFWEAMLIPMYFLILVSGAGPRKICGSEIHHLYHFGLHLMLVGVIKLYLMTSPEPGSQDPAFPPAHED